MPGDYQIAMTSGSAPAPLGMIDVGRVTVGTQGEFKTTITMPPYTLGEYDTGNGRIDYSGPKCAILIAWNEKLPPDSRTYMASPFLIP